jgi:hypothetical protein
MFRKLFTPSFGSPTRSSASPKHRRKLLQNRRLKVESLEARRVFAGLLLNEIVADTPGTDTPFEFVEIKGIPGQVLSDIYFVSVEGDSASQGLADVVVNLSGSQIGSNGLLIIKADGIGHTVPPETTIVIGPETFNSGGGALENGSNSFVLIKSPTPINIASDLDPENDGVLNLPEGATLIDAVGWLDGGAGDIAYGAILTQAATFPPGAATRFPHDNRVSNSNAWYSGDLVGTNSSVTYTSVAASRSANFPEGGLLTPGAFNVPGDANQAPVTIADEYSLEPGGTININAAAGVLSNDTDPNGANSILWAILDSADPANASSFVFNSDGSFLYANNGTTGDVTFSYKATDLNLISTTTLVTLKVAVSNNNAPTISVPEGPSQFTEGDSPVVIASGATLSDSDSANFASGSLSVTITENAEESDSLSVRNQGTAAGEIGLAGNLVTFGGVSIGILSGGSGATPLTIDLNVNATPPAVEALMRNITFSNNSDNPGISNRRIQFQVNDGDGGPAGGLSNVAFTLVQVVAINDAPTLTASRSATFYSVSTGAAIPVSIDGQLEIADPDSLNFGGGRLTVSLAQGTSEDLLSIRSVGNAAGQVSINGNEVLFGGTVVGTWEEGNAIRPLTVDYNDAATVEAANAIARSVVFATTSQRIRPETRSVTFQLTDGDGGSSLPAVYSVDQSLTRRFAFQQGVDYGQGVYAGAGDIQLAENQPDSPLPIGANPVTEGLLVDWDGGTANSQVLLRFDNLFGDAAGQIPLGATIVSARLVLHTKNGGDGATLHRMLTDWNPDTETWNSFGNGVVPRNGIPAVQADDAEARIAWDSQIGVAAANSDPAANPTLIGVTTDIQAWANGAANFGWVFRGWDTRADGWAFAASENADPSQRPKLEVEWIPSGTASQSFRQNVNGYTGVVDTALTEATPDATNNAATSVLVDFRDAGGANTSQVLLQFQNIVGGDTIQIPAGSLIHSAALDLASTTSNAQGDGGSFHRMLQAWDNAATWNSLNAGISADDSEARVAFNTSAGSPALNPNAEAGFNTFDVSKDVEAWVTDNETNNGWAILPWNLGTDGWGIQTSESTEAFRPRLRVYYTPVGIKIAPLGALETSEDGAGVQIAISLATPPKADVTIALSSSDTTEGTVDVASVVFTPSNWEIPQIITVSGVNDSLTDGDVTYSLVIGPATSSDANYQGLDPSDLILVNKDTTPSNNPPTITVSNAAVSGNEGTSITNTGTWADADASDVVTLTASLGTVTKNSDGTWNWAIDGLDDTSATTVTITATDAQGASSSVNFTYAVTNRAPDLSVTAASVSGAILSTLTNSGTWSDVAADTVTLAASVGTVTKNDNGTWNWSLPTTSAIDNQTVTITATDEDGGSSNVSFTINAVVTVVNSKVYHLRSSFAGSGVDAALDTGKVLAKSGPAARTLSYENLINSSRGINGLVFDVAGLPSATLSASDFVFRMSPTGSFNEAANPPSSWALAPTPSAIVVLPGSDTTPARVRVEWADNAIANRWLQIKLLDNANTGLRTPDVYYIGHLFGETTGTLTGGAYLVQTADVVRIRPQVGNSATVSNVLDINKNGLIQISDITGFRTQVGVLSLRNITIPEAGSGSEGEGPGRQSLRGSSAPLSGSGSTAGGTGMGLFSRSIAPRMTDRLYNEPSLVGLLPEVGGTAKASGQNTAVASPMPSDRNGNDRREASNAQATDIESIDRAFSNLGEQLGDQLDRQLGAKW